MNTRFTVLIRLLVIITCWPLANAHAQFSDTVYYSRQELREDLESLGQAIVQYHTNPFGFTPSDTFNLALRKAIASLPDSATASTFVPLVGDVINSLKDSHSSLDYTSLLNHQLEHGGYILPVRITSDSSGIYIRQDRDSILPAGARLLTLNGHSADSLWLQAWRLACVEGDASTGRRRAADAIFPIIAGLNLRPGPKMQVDVMPVDSVHIYRYTCRTYNKSRWEARRKALLKENQQPVRVSYPADSVICIAVETFAPTLPGQYARAIKRAFAEANTGAYKAAVIDMRDNGGGSSTWVEYLYSFLDPRGYNTPHNIIGRNSALARSRLRGLKSPAARFMTRLLYRRNEDVQAILRITALPDGVNDTVFFQQPDTRRSHEVYTGPCYLLMNGMTASAGVDFCNHFIRSSRGPSFGEACLGPPTGTWGNPAPFVLHHSQVRVYISTIRYNYDDTFQYERRPVAPDHSFPPSPRDIAAGKDAGMQAVLEYIRHSQP